MNGASMTARDALLFLVLLVLLEMSSMALIWIHSTGGWPV